MGEILSELRKIKNVTQDEMAKELNLTPQAISKWENNVSVPDTMMLPELSKYFGVSIDYLFNGNPDDKNIYEAVKRYIRSFGQFKGFPQAVELFGCFHNSLSLNNFSGDRPIYVSSSPGVSLYSEKGYGFIAERKFFENISYDTLTFAEPILKCLSNINNYKIILNILSMDEISYSELKENLSFDDETLRKHLDILIENQLITEIPSKHKLIGTVYHIGHWDSPVYHTLFCILSATFEMTRIAAESGFGCCAGTGDYPINLK